MRYLLSISAESLRRLLPSTRLACAGGLLLCLLTGCATTARSPDETAGQGAAASADQGRGTGGDIAVAAPLPGVELTPRILYELLLAEIAGQRGQMNVSVAAYADLARTTRDPRIVRRAAEVALFARQNDMVLQLAQLWTEVEPESLRARQMLIGALVGANRVEEVEPHVALMLQRDPAHAGDLLLRLSRSVATNQNRTQFSAMLERLAATRPALPESSFVRAYAAQLAGDRSRALSETEAALDKRPDWDQAVLFRAQLLQETGRFPDAMATLKDFLGRYPHAREVRLQYARALTGEKKFAEARQEFLTLEKDNPDSAEILHAVAILSLQLGDVDAAEARFKALVDLGQGDPNAFRLALGQIEESRQHVDEALKWYDAIDSGEQKMPARLRHAGLLSSQKGLDAALAYLKGVPAANDAERAQLLLGQAQLQRDAGRDKDAFDTLEKGLKANPDQTELLYESALQAEKVGRKDLLETRLRRLIKLKPDFAHAYNALGYSLTERGERLDEAQALISKAVELAPGDPFILDSLGWVLYRKGDLEPAREKLAQALALRPDPEIAAHLGEVLWKLGRHDDAERTWKDAARIAPANGVLTATMKKFLSAATQ